MRIAARPAGSISLNRSLRQPGPVVVAIRLDDKGVSFPPAGSVSQVSRNWRISRQFSPVGPDVPPRMAPLEKLHDAVRQNNQLKSKVECHQSRPTHGITNIVRILRIPLGRVTLVGFE